MNPEPGIEPEPEPESGIRNSKNMKFGKSRNPEWLNNRNISLKGMTNLFTVRKGCTVDANLNARYGILAEHFRLRKV